jgi:hypothetical protein
MKRGFLSTGNLFFVQVKRRNPMTEKQEAQTKEERATPRKPDDILTKKIRGKILVTEIYFDKKSKDTFQDKLLKIVQSERKE